MRIKELENKLIIINGNKHMILRAEISINGIINLTTTEQEIWRLNK